MLGIVLGGGAAKGYAHIGVIKFLEELNIKPDIIVGASMGSLIGGFYAKGFTAYQMEEIALKIDKKKKKELFRLCISKEGFINGKNIVKFLKPYLGGTKIEELPVKYAAVATDIEENAEIVIDRGDLIEAIRSSIAIPIVFTPNKYSGRILIDGGFVNPVPVDVATRLGAKKIIAVNVLPRFEYPQIKISEESETGKKYNIKDIFLKTFELISSRLITYDIFQIKEGVWIDINTAGIGLSQFEKAREAILRGYNQVKGYTDQILRLVDRSMP
ncbi:MAG: patatin-like phospholipase family protein [candidate division WOR-3 bacterium]|nr:patatin-like phospholipase family protein [candidate division WOR-3 bacterium]